MADWSSLPADLVNRVGDCFLASNDLDYYMEFRAVCHNWRSATADPRTSPEEPCFRPRWWVMLDELYSDDDTHLFVNATTGRFLHKSLPLLRRYYLVTTTTGGFIILSDRKPPHAAQVLNPFTGSLTRFLAPVPRQMHLAAAVVGSADSFTLVMASDSAREVYWADPESDAFFFEVCNRPSGMLPYIAGKYAGCKSGSVVTDTDEANKIIDNRRSAKLEYRVCAADSASGEVLVVSIEKGSHRIGISKAKMDSPEGVLEPVTSIGSRALFVGDRCLLVNSNKLPSIDANCIYYQVDCPDGWFCDDVYVYDINHGRAERIAESISTNTVMRENAHPLALLDLLVSYTMNIPEYELPWELMLERIPETLIDAAYLEDFDYDYDDVQFGD
uniref:KIB1-4 beta-propeller domain-containing protein n=1 Tax=Arundo donax TaxID=35708 RepID=A0A0A9AUZ7_ARUDO